MKSINSEQARKEAFEVLLRIRSNDGTRLVVLELIDAMLAAYQAGAIDCTEKDLPVIRAAGAQLNKLRTSLTVGEAKHIGLFLP